VGAYVKSCPGTSDIAAMDDEKRKALRDLRLGALANYVISLDRRHGFWAWLFRQTPEREARR